MKPVNPGVLRFAITWILGLLYAGNLFAQNKPVIKLDDVYIEGSVRKPPLTELKGSQLQEKVEQQALQNLIRLEKRLLKPLDSKQYRK